MTATTPAISATPEYNHARIEREAQARWQTNAQDKKDDTPPDKFSCQAMYADLSGKFHLGHCRRYILNDIVARYQGMRGLHVEHSVGFEAFGLQVHLAARDTGMDPEQWVASAATHARSTLERLGISANWQNVTMTSDTKQCRLQQQLFLRLWNAKNSLIGRDKQAGIAYWDPGARMFLSLRQLVNGRGPESGMLIEIRNIDTYALSISPKLANDLLLGLEKLTHWDNRVKNMQRESIGREDGLTIPFPLLNRHGKSSPALKVFTSHPDTMMGTTFLAVATTHPLARQISRRNPKVAEFCATVNQPKYAIEKLSEDKRQEGMPLGIYAINPVTGDHVPVWVANYVVANYGTSAVLGIPAHDQRNYNFAQQHNLPMRKVTVVPGESIDTPLSKPVTDKLAMLCNSGPLEKPINNLKTRLLHQLHAQRKQNGAAADTITRQRYFDQQLNACIHGLMQQNGIKTELTEVSRLRSWQISQPDYWGCPVPLIHCAKCGTVPVPEEQLPLLLPDYQDGKYLLEDYPDFIACTCPQCGADAKRETDTLNSSFSLAWQTTQAIQTETVYCCGAEQATSRLLCARILQLIDVKSSAPAADQLAELFCPGMVMNDGLPMAKSYANSIEPMQLLDSCGADLLRLYLTALENPRNDLHWEPAKLMNLQGVISVAQLEKLRAGALGGLEFDLVHKLFSKNEINRLRKGVINHSEYKQLIRGRLENGKYAQVKQVIGAGAIQRLQSGLLNETEFQLLRNGALKTSRLNHALQVISEFELHQLQFGLLEKHEFRQMQAGKLDNKKLAAVRRVYPEELLAKLQDQPVDLDQPGVITALQKNLLDTTDQANWQQYASELDLMRKVRTILTADELYCLQHGLLNKDEFAALRAGELGEEKMAQVRKLLDKSEIQRLQHGLLSREEMLQLKAGKLTSTSLRAVLEIIDERQIQQLQDGVLSKSEHEQLRSALGSSRNLARLRAGTLSADKLSRIRELFTADQLERYQRACLGTNTMQKLANFISTAQMNRLVNFVSEAKQAQLDKLLNAEQFDLLLNNNLGRPRQPPLLRFLDPQKENQLLNYLPKPSQDVLLNYLPCERMELLLGFTEHLWQIVTARKAMILKAQQYHERPLEPRRSQLHKCLAMINNYYAPDQQHDASMAVSLELNKVITRCREIIALLNEACDLDDDADCAFAAEAVSVLLPVLHPIMPHCTEQLWSLLQMPQLLAQTPWPQPDPNALEYQTELVCVIQENGHKRHLFHLAPGTSPDAAIELAKQELDMLFKRQGYAGFPSLGQHIVRIEQAQKQDQMVINFVLYLH